MAPTTRAAALAALVQRLDRYPAHDSNHGYLPLPELALPARVTCFVRHAAHAVQHPPLVNPLTYVLVLAVRGHGQVIVDGRTLCLRPGLAALIFPCQAHTYAKLMGPHFRWLFVTFELQHEALIGPLRSVLLRPGAEELQGLERLTRDYHLANPRDAVACARLSVGLLQCLLGLRAETHAESAAKAGDSRAEVLVYRAITQVSEQLDHPMQLAGIAHAVGVSKSYLRRAFQQVMRQPAGDYFRKLRIYRAACLLKDPTLSLKEIARQTGYSSPQAFSRAFHAEIHQPPRAFRQTLLDRPCSGP